MRRPCRSQRLIHFGGDEQQTMECERRLGHKRQHRQTWTAGMGANRWKIKVTWK